MSRALVASAAAAGLMLLAWWALRPALPGNGSRQPRLSAPEPVWRHKREASRGPDLPPAPGGTAARAASVPGAPPQARSPELPRPAAAAQPRMVPPAPLAPPAQKLAELEEILRSNNDNDPRLDGDFNELSPQTKELFRRKYAQTPQEDRNARGTIVFLLGRNLDSAEDWAFLRAVVGEPPCLSLADCSRKDASPSSDPHHEGGLAVTLAYPQMVALKQVERVLEGIRRSSGRGRGPALQEARSILRIAQSSREPMVGETASEIERRLARAP